MFKYQTKGLALIIKKIKPSNSSCCQEGSRSLQNLHVFFLPWFAGRLKFIHLATQSYFYNLVMLAQLRKNYEN